MWDVRLLMEKAVGSSRANMMVTNMSRKRVVLIAKLTICIENWKRWRKRERRRERKWLMTIFMKSFFEKLYFQSKLKIEHFSAKFAENKKDTSFPGPQMKLATLMLDVFLLKRNGRQRELAPTIEPKRFHGSDGCWLAVSPQPPNNRSMPSC